MWKRQRAWTIVAVVFGFLVLTAVIVISVIDEPLRQYLERKANSQLQGYDLRIGTLHVHFFRGGLEFKDLSLRQQEHPDPPVAWIESWTAIVIWRDLFVGRLVSNHHIVQPKLHITCPQAQEEAAQVQHEGAAGALEKRGWQDAVYALFPITINELKIDNAELSYRDHPDKDPLHLSAVDLKISNVQNVRRTDHTYPSEFSSQGHIFDTGRFELQGHADFLAEPRLGYEGSIKFDTVPIIKLEPLAERSNLHIRNGTIKAIGHVEYAPWMKEVVLQEVVLDTLQVDFVHAAQTAKKEKVAAHRVKQEAKELHQDSELVVKVDHLKILGSEMGFVNTARSPQYRVFLAGMNVDLDNFSNRPSEGYGTVKVTGRFMGSGPTVVMATFRPEKPNPDFDLDVSIVKTHLKSFNDALRAYGHVDVSSGTFAFFSELKVKDGQVAGYVKPFFKDVEVYDPQQDKDKALTQKMYEIVVEGIAELLKNRPEEAVATKTDVTGPVDNPQASTWQIIVKLVQNAFFNAILPGIERQARLA
ncbi:MAG: DUF748 domain-containing protein [Nitrospirota bacterium]